MPPRFARRGFASSVPAACRRGRFAGSARRPSVRMVISFGTSRAPADATAAGGAIHRTIFGYFLSVQTRQALGDVDIAAPMAADLPSVLRIIGVRRNLAHRQRRDARPAFGTPRSITRPGHPVMSLLVAASTETGAPLRDAPGYDFAVQAGAVWHHRSGRGRRAVVGRCRREC